ncbi:alpha/beta hydrolase [Sphingomonas sp. KR3-1]|uniref:alpha/beta hydrolase n=1 Tax=Sphingomonas sp. KR3-1 TaxID=3156611 RepID=UPI0032B4024E
MARRILFIQGAGKGAHDDWDARLVASLSAELDTPVRYPRMPDEAEPRFVAWRAALIGEMAVLADGDLLIGHSVGGTMLLHVLAEMDPGFRPGALVLLAPPFVGEGGWESEDVPARTHFPLPAGMPALLFHGTADETVPPSHAALHAAAIPQLDVHLLQGRDHQLGNDLRDVAAAIRELH